MFPGPISSPAIVDQTQHRYHKGASLGIGLLIRWLVRRRITQRGPDLKRVTFTLQSFSIITFDAIAEIRSILSPRDDGVLDRDEIIYRAF
jgi:hypothetical protein